MSLHSCDTNVLLHAINSDSPYHLRAAEYMAARHQDPEFRICELVLTELYVLLRNPAVLRRALDPAAAVAVCSRLRCHPLWGVLDYPGPLPRIMDRVWKAAAQPDFARRRVFDARLAYTLAHYGVTDFATQNTRDFLGLGLGRVYDPLS